MIVGTGLLWFLFFLLVLPFLTFIVTGVLFSLLSSVPIIGPYLAISDDEVAALKEKSKLLFVLTAPFRFTAIAVPLLLPAYFIYVQWTDYANVYEFRTINGEVAQDDSLRYGFERNAYLGLAQYMPYVGIGSHLENFSPDGNSDELNSLIKMARDNEDLAVFINTSKRPLYVEHVFYGEKTANRMAEVAKAMGYDNYAEQNERELAEKIKASQMDLAPKSASLVVKAEAFRMGCANVPPADYTFIEQNRNKWFLSWVTEVPNVDCATYQP